MFSKSCLLQRRQQASIWGKGLNLGTKGNIEVFANNTDFEHGRAYFKQFSAERVEWKRKFFYRLIKELFQHATSQKGRSVIFIDEIDSICRQRNAREEEHTRRMKTELLKQMEGADNSSLSDKIFLLCATNCPWELDSAFLRRFQKRIYIPLPNK